MCCCLSVLVRQAAQCVFWCVWGRCGLQDRASTCGAWRGHLQASFLCTWCDVSGMLLQGQQQCAVSHTVLHTEKACAALAASGVSLLVSTGGEGCSVFVMVCVWGQCMCFIPCLHMRVVHVSSCSEHCSVCCALCADLPYADAML